MLKERIPVLQEGMVWRPERPRADPRKQVALVTNADMPLLLWRSCPGVKNLDDLPTAEHALKDGEPCRLREVRRLLVPLWVSFVQQILVLNPAPVCGDIRRLFVGHINQFVERMGFDHAE